MGKLVIKRHADRQPTQEDVEEAVLACVGGTTARQLAGRTGMPLKTAMRALWAAQRGDKHIKNEYVPLKGSFCVQQLLYTKLA